MTIFTVISAFRYRDAQSIFYYHRMLLGLSDCGHDTKLHLCHTYVSKVFPLLVIFGTECQVAEETVRLSEPSCSVLPQSSLRYVGGVGESK